MARSTKKLNHENDPFKKEFRKQENVAYDDMNTVPASNTLQCFNTVLEYSK